MGPLLKEKPSALPNHRRYFLTRPYAQFQLKSHLFARHVMVTTSVRRRVRIFAASSNSGNYYYYYYLRRVTDRWESRLYRRDNIERPKIDVIRLIRCNDTDDNNITELFRNNLIVCYLLSVPESNAISSGLPTRLRRTVCSARPCWHQNTLYTFIRRSRRRERRWMTPRLSADSSQILF